MWENPKAVKNLHEIFGIEDSLVQIYVRDLLSMHATEEYLQRDFLKLYDDLEMKLRSLESLGSTQEIYDDFLNTVCRMLSSSEHIYIGGKGTYLS
ncbi:hypothetical protein CDAR_556101 [Caerostris darwini]|uniref:Phosphoenolpyruvate carboxylase n=1 Tax=Caerostris darwini TaxID=1538125 RepID=A0AAV4STP6_9ARAC|nr:hypothetical protein CDAR_556101 [Caerostris darwini]